MGHTNNFQSSGWGCQILPWSWDSKSRLIGISQGGRYKRGVSSENQVWEGQNGAMRRRRAPLTFSLHSTAGISFIGGNAYRLTFGHGWANASMPRVVVKLRENQSGHWDDSWKAKRSTSALPNRYQIWDPVWRFNIHSPGLSFCLDRKSAARFSIPGMWTALKERNLSLDQRRRRHASLSRVRATVNLLGGLCGTQPPYCPSWLWYDTPENGEKILQSQEDSPEFQAVYMPREELLLPLPARRSAFEDRAPACHWCVRRDHMATVDRTHSHPAPEKSGGLATLKGVDSNCATPW